MKVSDRDAREMSAADFDATLRALASAARRAHEDGAENAPWLVVARLLERAVNLVSRRSGE